MRRRVFVFLVLMLSAASASGEYRWEYHVYGNDVRDLAYADGRLWWATTAGLVEMDLADTSYTVHRRSARGLPSDSINAVVFDAEGNLWCGTASGGLGVRLASGGWRVLRSIDGLPHDIERSPRILSLSARGGSVTVGTADGFVTFLGLDSGTAWSCTVLDPCVEVLPSMAVQSVMALADTIWYGTSKGPVRYVPADTLGLALRRFGSGLRDSTVRAFARFRGVTWVGTDDGAYRFDPAGERWEHSDGISDDVVDFLVVGDTLLAASDMPSEPDFGQVYIWNGTERRWDPFGGTAYYGARALAVDGDGVIWLGTAAGVRSYDPDGRRWNPRIEVAGPPSSKFWSVGIGNRDEVWFGYKEGLAAAFDDADWHKISGGGLSPKHTQAIHVDHTGRIWFGHCCCDDCLLDRASGPSATHLGWVSGLPAKNLRAIVDDGNGHYWMGSTSEDPDFVGEGLYLWKEGDPPDAIARFNDLGDTTELASNTIAGLAIDARGRLWIGHRKGGVHQGRSVGVDIWDYGPDPHETVDDAWIHLSRLDSNLNSDNVLSIAADGDRVWVGTDAGVNLYENGLLRACWGGASFCLEDPFEDPFVTALAVTSDHSAWAGTGAGVVRFVPNALGTYDIERYAFPDLSNNKVNALAADGMRIWIATERGLTVGTPAGGEEGEGFGRRATLNVYPNPFIPGYHQGLRLHDVTVRVDGEIYDAAGARVASFEDVRPGEIVWNGRIDQTGEPVAPGLYAVVARSGAQSLTARVAVVR